MMTDFIFIVPFLFASLLLYATKKTKRLYFITHHCFRIVCHFIWGVY